MNKNFSILVVDDEKDMRESLKDLLELDGYKVVESETAAEAISLYKYSPFDLVLSDIIMPKMDGIELLRKLKEIDQNASVILITGYSSIEGAIEAIKLGAEDYFTKPFKAIEIRKTIDRLYSAKYLSEQNEKLKQGILRTDFPEIIGNSSAINSVFDDINTVAKSDVSVLIYAESGAGKELVANAIHKSSDRCNEPFIPINCAAVPKDLLESEFFGHEKGAFSGAVKRKYGIFEIANKGTLFLDEIGEMPIDLQAKLLRTVETKVIRRIGSTDLTPIDIRIVCSTNRNLKNEIKLGNFREDLYFRLATFQITVPPLRERVDDIPLLIANFFKKKGLKKIEFPETIIKTMQNYNWPGNVRELENIIERIILLSKIRPIEMSFLPDEIRSKSFTDVNFEKPSADTIESLENVEKEYIRKIYLHCKGNKVRTAKILGIGLKTLYRKLEKFSIEFNNKDMT